MIILISVLASQGVLRFVDAFGDLPLWADMLIAGVASACVSLALYAGKKSR